MDGSPVDDIEKLVQNLRSKERPTNFAPLAAAEEKLWSDWVKNEFLPFLEVSTRGDQGVCSGAFAFGLICSPCMPRF